jgi:signal transduction histidine kinase
MALLDTGGSVRHVTRSFGGLALADCLGRPFVALLSADLGGALRHALDEVRQHHVVVTRQISGEGPGGEVRDQEFCAAPVLRGANLEGFVVATRDITDRQAVARHVASRQRMDLVARFAAGVQDEVERVVLAMDTSLAFTARPGMAPARDEASVEHAEHAAVGGLLASVRRAAEFARQLGLIAGLGPRGSQPVSLNDLLDELLGFLRRSVPPGVSIDFVPGHHLELVAADASLLQEVVTTLFLTARDDAPRSGQITVETENVLINGAYIEAHPWARPGRYVLLTLSNFGVGLSPAEREHAFEPFLAAERHSREPGLGLAASYGIVRMHDGLLHVYSEPGRGTTFKVYLPVLVRPAGSVGSKVAAPVAGGTETVLVADDDPDVVRLTRRVLERAGYVVVAAANGSEAVQLYREHGERINLVVADVAMPGMSGPEAGARIRAIDPDARILFVSGSSAGALSSFGPLTPFVAKPYVPDDLLRAVRAVLDRPDPH